MSACQLPLGPCFNPCDDVKLCVSVDKAQDKVNLSLREYVYMITLQNCSNSTLVGNFDLVLGKGLQCNLNPPLVAPIVGFPSGNSFCAVVVPETVPNTLWNGVSDVRILSNAVIPPGSYQFWWRFTQTVPVTTMLLDSTVVFYGNVYESNCHQPCAVKKCVHVKGDCLLPPP